MGMDWKKFQWPPIAERKGARIFKAFTIGGIVFMILALGGVYLDGLRERLCGFLAGACLTAGAGGTLALTYGDWSEEGRFALRIAVRLGFLPIAPFAVLIELPYFLEDVGIWGVPAFVPSP